MNLAGSIATLNWLAVAAATVVAFLLGGLWYSKALFGSAWMQDVGLTEEAIGKANTAKTFVGTFFLQFIAATALAIVLGPDSNWLVGLQVGFWVGLLWVASAYAVTYLFEQRSFRLFAINAGYYVVLYALMGAIIGAWP